jgi:hypothetical protein
VSARYQVLPPTASVPAPGDVLEAMAREGARSMLARALEIEREEFLGRLPISAARVPRLPQTATPRSGPWARASLGRGTGLQANWASAGSPTGR